VTTSFFSSGTRSDVLMTDGNEQGDMRFLEFFRRVAFLPHFIDAAAELAPATNSLEGAWSHNDFNARSDIFTFRAPFEAVAEFRFVGMPISGPDVTPRRWSNGFQLTTEVRRDLDNPGTLGELASTFQVRFAASAFRTCTLAGGSWKGPPAFWIPNRA